jgi:tetratricopeptide (TPR) repeat protein
MTVVELIASARAFYHERRLPMAELQLRAALEFSPEEPSALLLLGIIQVRTQRLEEGATTLSRSLKIAPGQVDAFYWLAVCKRMEGRLMEAVEFARRAVQIDPSNSAAYTILGLSLLDQGDAAGAVDALQNAADLSPASAPALHNLGRGLAAANRHAEALASYLRAADIAPKDVPNYLAIATECELVGAWEIAKQSLQRGIAENPSSVPLLLKMAKTFAQLNEQDKAERIFRRALDLEPRAAVGYGLWLQENGRFKEASDQLSKAIELEPRAGIAYFGLAEAKAFDRPHGSLIESALDAESLTGLDDYGRMFLSYALARGYEHEGKYELSAENYDLANERAFALYRTNIAYDGSRIRDLSEVFHSVLNGLSLPRLIEEGNTSSQPIFILGMIRSGTTLVDQIIASHPMVASAGEQPFWSQFGEATLVTWAKEGVDTERLRSLSCDYLALLHRVAGAHDRITDKMPLNFEYLGLINAAFPRAKIVHVRRNPIDTCWSIYTTHFGLGPTFAYCKANISDYYRHYVDEMAYWRKLLPAETLFEIDYEELVASPEATIRSLIRFLELPWDDACLRHDKSGSAVMTPSRWQARQPIYQSSKGRWKNFESSIGEFIEIQSL